MKKFITLSSGLFLGFSLFAGGIVTNTNQGVRYTRLQACDAMIGIEGVYFNPAGLTLLPNDGLYFSLNNQTIGQTVTINSNYQFLTGYPDTKYTGTVSAPVFPGVYAAYKTGKLVISAGFNPVGGGGGAEYKKGLPSFEMPISNLVPSLQGSLLPIDQAIEDATGSNPGFRNITGYSYDVYFKGTSTIFGYQANISYAINDKISVAVGGRYVMAKNTYQGHLNDIMINAPAAYGGLQTAGDYLRLIAGQIASMDATTAAILQGQATALDGLTADKDEDNLRQFANHRMRQGH